MATFNKLRNVNEIVAGIREQAEKDIAETIVEFRRQAEERVRLVEANRLAFAMLDAAGFDLHLPEYHSGAHYALDLGFFPNTKAGNAALAEKVRGVRLALGCRLTHTSKDAADYEKKTVQFIMTPSDYHGIKVCFERKLPRTARCKLVRKRSTYTQLVCSTK